MATIKELLDQKILYDVDVASDEYDATIAALATEIESEIVLEEDTSTADMDFVVDEDDMVSDSATKLCTQQSIKAYVDAHKALTTSGTVNTGTTAVETGAQSFHKTVLTVSSTLPAIAGGASLSVGKLLYTFPAGAIVVHCARMSMAITQSQGNINADTPDGGLGTTIAAGANALLSDTSGAENILTGQTFNNCTGTVELKTVADQVLVIEAAGDHTVYFNVADGWAASGDAAAAIAGTVVLEWSLL